MPDQKFKPSDMLIYGGVGLITHLLTKQILKSLKDTKKEEEEIDLAARPSRRASQMILKVYRSTIPKEIKNTPNALIDELKYLDSPLNEILKVNHLSWDLDNQGEFVRIKNPCLGDTRYRSVYGGEGFLPDDSFVYRGSFVLSAGSFGPKFPLSKAKRFLRAGPRKHLYFHPEEVTAAIVTCGGLCPGLNVVIREVVMSLWFNYKVRKIYGIQFGYRGFYSYQMIELNPETVKSIHRLGGTMLGSSRGGFDLQPMIENLKAKNINQLYVLGGDGTHKGIRVLYNEIKKQKLKIGICGLPKTIDNDIPIIDKSFGFESSVEEALKAIRSAYVESHSAEYGVGLVRVMGRNAGFIAMESSAAARDVNICLVPEFKFDLYGEKGLLEFVAQRLLKRRHCVIVVAEGADTAIRDADLLQGGTDASGNRKLADCGIFLRDEINKYCKSKNIDITLKYIDPTYMIRTVPANAYDTKLCSQLAQNATHGLMAGFTGFSVGHVNNTTCYIPLDEILSNEYSNQITSSNRTYQRLMASTGQPSFLND